MYDLLVAGAGPYGLSIASHAAAAGLRPGDALRARRDLHGGHAGARGTAPVARGAGGLADPGRTAWRGAGDRAALKDAVRRHCGERLRVAGRRGAGHWGPAPRALPTGGPPAASVQNRPCRDQRGTGGRGRQHGPCVTTRVRQAGRLPRVVVAVTVGRGRVVTAAVGRRRVVTATVGRRRVVTATVRRRGRVLTATVRRRSRSRSGVNATAVGRRGRVLTAAVRRRRLVAPAAVRRRSPVVLAGVARRSPVVLVGMARRGGAAVTTLRGRGRVAAAVLRGRSRVLTAVTRGLGSGAVVARRTVRVGAGVAERRVQRGGRVHGVAADIDRDVHRGLDSVAGQHAGRALGGTLRARVGERIAAAQGQHAGRGCGHDHALAEGLSQSRCLPARRSGKAGLGTKRSKDRRSEAGQDTAGGLMC
ncbi:hypothetical protein FB157_104148 [Streptomyces sp. BK340]|nr:hypothetical protein FB157_104148 [Streptomyces sp. BK340]